MNLINILSKNISKTINLEKNNLFCFLVLFFIIGVLLAENNLEYYDFVLPIHRAIIAFILLGIFLVLIVFNVHMLKNYCIKVFLLFSIFLLLGFLVFYCKALFNKTQFLTKNLKYVHLTGKVFYINHKNNTKLSTIFLKNIVINNYEDINYEDINYLKNICLSTYNNVNFLKKGDVITVWADLKPIYTLSPFEKFIQGNAFWKNVEATGFIISKIQKISENKNISLTNINLYINSIKQYFFQKIDNNLINNTSSIAKAIILGNSSGISTANREALVNSGLSPFIAISGLHISIITTFLFLFIRFGLSLIPVITLNVNTKKVAAVITIFVLIFYLTLLSHVPSALRAGIMAILVLLGILFNFYTFSVRNLLLAVFLLLLFKPEYIGYPSFLMSFLATAVIIIIFNNKIIKNFSCIFNKNIITKVCKYIILTSLLSLTVSIVVFPILVYFFNKIPVYGVFANLIVTPLFSLIIMPFLFISIILPEPFCRLFFNIVDISINFMLEIAYYLNNFKLCNIYFASFDKVILAFYIVLFILFVICSSKLKYIALIFCIFIYIYIWKNPYPHIMIDKYMNLVAFLNKDKYVFSTLKGNSFIKNLWVRDSNKIDTKSLKYNTNFKCDKNGNCVMNMENFLVAYNTTKDYIKEACLNAQLIIVNDTCNFTCKDCILIDKNFLENFGSTFIYFIKPNKIKIVSCKKNLTIKLNIENNGKHI